ncbi:MAG: ribose-phosphate pyrophosphokinase [Verrucomicrobiota bacterium]|nr:ribose-phosphate pyrophosphokinase [Verrucomicrobiota bacterium]
MESDSSFMLFAGSSHEELAQNVARQLQIPVGKVLRETFPDGEIGIQVQENVRGKDVFVLQSLARRPNHYLMELLIMVDALKRASVRSVCVVLPYYAYGRQDRKDKGRVPITAKLVANLLEKAGVTRVMVMDLHTEQIQGFFDIPVDHLYARPIFIRTIQKLRCKDIVVVSPDVGSNKMARKFAEDLHVDLAIVDKRRVNSTHVEVNAVIGDVKGKHVLLVDDMCSTGGTLKTAAKACLEEGATSVDAIVTHGLFVGHGLKGSRIGRMFVTDTIPPPEEKQEVKLEYVSVAPLLAEAIDCVVKAKSISSLFKC